VMTSVYLLSYLELQLALFTDLKAFSSEKPWVAYHVTSGDSSSGVLSNAGSKPKRFL